MAKEYITPEGFRRLEEELDQLFRGERRKVTAEVAAAATTFDTPHTYIPKTRLLSNGSYTTMITNAGGGFSAWPHRSQKLARLPILLLQRGHTRTIRKLQFMQKLASSAFRVWQWEQVSDMSILFADQVI